MATIVKLKDGGARAILVGVGYGMHKSSRPNAFFGDLISTESEGESMMAAISTAEGDILWCPTDAIQIVSVDGQTPREALLG